MNKINSEDYRVREGEDVDLEKWPTAGQPVCASKDDYKSLLEAHVAQLSRLQQLHYACNRHAVLLIFQAMDAAGKDGAIRHVMSGVNPQGCQVFSFKHPGPTSTQDSPWYVVPADDKESARLIVSQIVVETLNGLKMRYPKVSKERREALRTIREQLAM